MTDAADPSRRAERRDARRAGRALRRADIDRRARVLAARQVEDKGEGHWSLDVAMAFIAVGFLAGCYWLFREQTRFAHHLGFETPWLFSLIVDGTAFFAAFLAYGISMSGRTSGGSRAFSAVVISLSAAANGAGAWHRSHDATVVVVAALVPLVLMWGFHLLLGELRLRVLIRRNRPADKAAPGLRLIRVLLAGRWAFTEWRAAGLAVTDPLPHLAPAAGGAPPQREPGADAPRGDAGTEPPAAGAGWGASATVTSLTGRERTLAASARSRQHDAALAEDAAREFIAARLAETGALPNGATVAAHCGRSANWGIGVVGAVRRERAGKTG